MSALRSLVCSAVAATPADVAAALNNIAPEGARYNVPSFYLDSAVRSTMRALLDAAGNSGSRVNLGFFKKDGELRYMRALPIPEADGTNQYYTVLDLELSAEQFRSVYRRVNLDRVIAAQVEFRASALPA